MSQLHEAEIRARIKHARKEAGLSQAALAELLEVIPRTVQNYENDHVPWSRIRDISEITGKSTRWLLHGEDPPPAANESSDLSDQLGQLTAELTQLKGLITEVRASQLALALKLAAQATAGQQTGSDEPDLQSPDKAADNG